MSSNSDADDLANGRVSSRKLVERALARIADPAGEGARTFTKVYADTARAEADHSDRLRRAGIVRSPVEGLPVSVKDLFDVGGRCDARGFEDPRRRPAGPTRCRRGGAIARGRRRDRRAHQHGGVRIRCGRRESALRHAEESVRSRSWDAFRVDRRPARPLRWQTACVRWRSARDTRGSIRVPAALCGVTGFKPTARRVPRDGAFPLSYTLDSVGPLADSVADMRRVRCGAGGRSFGGANGPSLSRAAVDAAALRRTRRSRCLRWRPHSMQRSQR